jgi:N6-L-threonylcarbamoyladenine synthase
LLVGVNTAKAWAWSTGKPMIAVNHLEGHVHANWLRNPGDDTAPPAFPAMCLLVSGGHTELILMRSHHDYELLGQTIDDAAGEAFDKGARLLGLGYPGGPAIQRASEGGDPAAFAFPRSQLGDSLDFSFSGLKTSLLRQVHPHRVPDDRPKPTGAIFPEHRPPLYRDDLPLADLAASYEEAIVDVLATKLVRATEQTGATTMLIAGGVAANRKLRDRVQQLVPAGVHVSWPAMEFCTDNAAMIAGRAWHLANQNAWGDLADDAYPKGVIANAHR